MMVREEKGRIYIILAGLENSMALASQVVETIYLHQAPKEPDEWQLLGEINKEVLFHRRCKYWRILSIITVPKGVRILEYIWARNVRDA
jgi:hypothetical protein